MDEKEKVDPIQYGNIIRHYTGSMKSILEDWNRPIKERFAAEVWDLMAEGLKDGTFDQRLTEIVEDTQRDLEQSKARLDGFMDRLSKEVPEILADENEGLRKDAERLFRDYIAGEIVDSDFDFDEVVAISRSNIVGGPRKEEEVALVGEATENETPRLGSSEEDIQEDVQGLRKDTPEAVPLAGRMAQEEETVPPNNLASAEVETDRDLTTEEKRIYDGLPQDQKKNLDGMEARDRKAALGAMLDGQGPHRAQASEAPNGQGPRADGTGPVNGDVPGRTAASRDKRKGDMGEGTGSREEPGMARAMRAMAHIYLEELSRNCSAHTKGEIAAKREGILQGVIEMVPNFQSKLEGSKTMEDEIGTMERASTAVKLSIKNKIGENTKEDFDSNSKRLDAIERGLAESIRKEVLFPFFFTFLNGVLKKEECSLEWVRKNTVGRESAIGEGVKCSKLRDGGLLLTITPDSPLYEGLKKRLEGLEVGGEITLNDLPVALRDTLAPEKIREANNNLDRLAEGPLVQRKKGAASSVTADGHKLNTAQERKMPVPPKAPKGPRI